MGLSAIWVLYNKATMQTNIDLTNLNTLQVPAKARYYLNITDWAQLPALAAQGAFQQPYLFLGQGANILFTRNFPGLVARIAVPGYRVLAETDQDVTIAASAGQDWHELVMWTVANNWSGMENMALIPGTVGAAAVGNIAAYGQNQETILEQVTALDLETGQERIFTNAQCHFAYRESIFKLPEYHRYLLTTVTYRLSKVAHLNTSYRATRHGSLLQELVRLRPVGEGDPPYTIQEVAQSVINLRSAKLPDWHVIGTAGSFFKNPVVPRSQAELLQKTVPDLQFYPADRLTYADPQQTDPYVKLPAGRLLDELGWRGRRSGSVGTYPTHALVVCNFGGASGQEVFDFAEQMRQSVKDSYAVDLEYEVILV